MDVACAGPIRVTTSSNGNVRVDLYTPDGRRVDARGGRNVFLQSAASTSSIGQWKVIVTGGGGNVGVNARLEYPARSDCPSIADQIVSAVEIPENAAILEALGDRPIVVGLPEYDPTPTMVSPDSAQPVAEPTATMVVQDTALPEPTPLPEAAEILTPADGSVLSGVVDVLGSASMRNFGYYKFELVDDRCGPTRGCHIASFGQPVLNDVLMQWDTHTLPNGTYLIRLMVVNKDGVLYATMPHMRVTISN
jgi:hypothetical protein